MATPTPFAFAVLIACTLAPAQNLIPDPSFELGTFPASCATQGVPLSSWFLASPATPGADTWTFDCVLRPGTTVGLPYPPHWASPGSAHTGSRLMAGWSFPSQNIVEPYGTTLSAPLVPGVEYRLSAYFVRSQFHASAGGLTVRLNTTPTVGGCILGTIGTSATTTAWTADCLEFTAPAGCGTALVFEPFGVDSYIGTDDWVLTLAGPVVAMSQPGGAGGGLVLLETGLVASHEYFTIGTFGEPCPGGVGTGPYLGLCTADVNGLVAQVASPLGSPPFHYIASECSLTVGPVALPAGLVLQVVLFDFTGGALGPVSATCAYTVL